MSATWEAPTWQAHMQFNPKCISDTEKRTILLAKARANKIDTLALAGTSVREDKAFLTKDTGAYWRLSWPGPPKHKGRAPADPAAGLEFYANKAKFSEYEIAGFKKSPKGLEGRLGLVRFRRRAGAATSFDITYIIAYAPNNPIGNRDNDTSQQQLFWKTLNKWILELPKRIMLVLGMDANAHVCLDDNHQLQYKQSNSNAPIGPLFPELTNGNGKQLIQCATKGNLAAINTFPHPTQEDELEGPTWGTSQKGVPPPHRIDYILMDHAHKEMIFDIESNKRLEERFRVGDTPDHWPIIVRWKHPGWDQEAKSTIPRTRWDPAKTRRMASDRQFRDEKI